MRTTNNQLCDIISDDMLFGYILGFLTFEERSRIKSVCERFRRTVNDSMIHPQLPARVNFQQLGSIHIPIPAGRSPLLYGKFFDHARNYINTHQQPLLQQAENKAEEIFNPVNRCYNLRKEDLGNYCVALIGAFFLLLASISAITYNKVNGGSALAFGIGAFLLICSMTPKVAKAIANRMAQRQIHSTFRNTDADLTEEFITHEDQEQKIAQNASAKSLRSSI